ncbi:hypothetical protein [Flavobacterium foetidum]|uniref:hypothetical protein n=1 Tax=Flavobacterium foetidum TaxID=2026681 RepID=UPI0010757E06|nr:hypothetical protein [Flavobacterium foetidum]KAF2517786.1 hypothetical protein E0W73_00850 [Flavobacterium foetidum]
MKKFTYLLLFALMLNGCDDGDLTVDQIDFESVNSQSCTLNENLIYKLKNQEALLLQLVENAGIIEDDSTYKYNIEPGGKGNYRVVYRAYDGTVATDNICGTIPPSTPKVSEEWLATSGVINITSKQKTSAPAQDGSTKIEGYNHSINFTNITFLLPSGKEQTYPTYPFGNLSSTLSIPASLVFATPETAYKCDDQNRVYNFTTSFFIMIDNISPDLLKNEVTPLGSPRRQLVGTTTNRVVYRTVKESTGSFSRAYFCNGTSFPSTPGIDLDFTADSGVEGQSGIIEVVTEEVAGVFYHTITLKAVKMRKGNSSFSLPTNFLLGKIS